MGGGYVYVLASRRFGLRRWRLGRSATPPGRLASRFRGARVLHSQWFDDADAAFAALAERLTGQGGRRGGLLRLTAGMPAVLAAFARAAAPEALARARRVDRDHGLFRQPMLDPLPQPAAALARAFSQALNAAAPRGPHSLAALMHPVARGFALGMIARRLKALGLPGEYAPEIYARALQGALGVRLKPEAAALAFALAPVRPPAIAAGTAHDRATAGRDCDALGEPWALGPLQAFAAAPASALSHFDSYGTLPGARTPGARLRSVLVFAVRVALFAAAAALLEPWLIPATGSDMLRALLVAYGLGLFAIAIGLVPGSGLKPRAPE